VVEKMVLLLGGEYKTFLSARSVLKMIAEKTILSNEFIEMLLGPFNELLFKNDDLITIRVYETVAELAILTSSGFESMKSYHLLDAFTNFSYSDILISLNMIQVFTELSKSENGYLFLKRTGVFDKLSDFSAISNHFVLHSVIKFWGFVIFHCPVQAEGLAVKHLLFDKLQGLYEAGDVELKDQVIVALGNIGSTKTGMLILERHDRFLHCVLDSLPNVSGTLRVSGLRTISCLLSHMDPKTDSVCRSVYRSIGSEPFKTLVHLAKSSIEDVSVAALACIKEVVQFPWGLRDFAQSGTHSFFLERRKELNNVIREWKYSIVQQVALDSNSLSYFSTPVYDQFVEFNRQGPYKSDYTPQVAFESA
jgi:hypothetical protein